MKIRLFDDGGMQLAQLFLVARRQFAIAPLFFFELACQRITSFSESGNLFVEIGLLDNPLILRATFINVMYEATDETRLTSLRPSRFSSMKLMMRS